MTAAVVGMNIIGRCCNRLIPSRCQHHLSSSSSSSSSKTRTLLFSSSAPKHEKPKYLLPKRIILLRHGESLGNVDDTAYSTIPDWKIPLTRRGERQALRAAKDLTELLDGEALFTYCSPYKRASGTWDIIEDYIEDSNSKNDDNKAGVEIIGMREEPRIAEQQFGNFQNPHKVRTAKSERRTFGRFFFRFPDGESGMDVYSRCSSFLATLSRDIKQIDQRYSYLHRHDDIVENDETETITTTNTAEDSSSSNSTSSTSTNKKKCAMANMNILIVCHGLTLRLLLMRYFRLTVEEFENSYNSQNAKLVVLDRFVYNDSDADSDPGNRKYYCNLTDSHQYREYFKLDDTAKEALNLLGDVSTKRPNYGRDATRMDGRAATRMDDEFNGGMLLIDGDDDLEE